MFNTSKILALGTALALMGLSTTAFADTEFGRENAQQYAVSAQETLQPLTSPKLAATAVHTGSTGIGSLIGASDPHWGPAFDPDAE